MDISYGHWRKSEREFVSWVAEWAAAHDGAAICDVGGGANPLLDSAGRIDRRYLVVDIDGEELSKCPDDVEKLLADVSAAEFSPPSTFDLVVSKTTAEHVADPYLFHRNIRSLLDVGGVATHYFPTMGALPFVVNRLIPESISERILLKVQPSREKGGDHEKFPALYRRCAGPTRAQLDFYRETGFEVERFRAYFGHGYYWKVPRLDRLEEQKTRFLLKNPRPRLVSYASVVLRAV